MHIYCVLKDCDKIMLFRFNFDDCPMIVHLMHQNFSPHALFCQNSPTKVNELSLIYYTLHRFPEVQTSRKYECA